MDKSPNRQAAVDSRRIALEREVVLRFPAFDTFVTEYSANISTTGMFIVSEDPQAPGSSFTFEFRVADDWKLIRGKGQVVWARHRDEGPNRPPGMGIRFAELDPQSRRLIRWIVEKHIREGGRPFEIDELRSTIDEALEQALEPSRDKEGKTATRPKPAAPFPDHVSAVRAAPVSAPAGARVKPRRRRLPTGALTAVGVIALIAALIWLSEVGPRLTQEVEAPQEQTESGDAAAAQATDTEPGPEPETPQEETSAEPTASAVAETVASWSAAWSDQSVDRYLAHYSRSFQPAGGLSLSDWQVQRRERLAAPAFIRVAISGLETSVLDDQTARASFFQSYRSDSYADQVQKVLDLVWEDESWRIARERAL